MEHFPQEVHFCGPSGIRTHDLLNAIETRSQLRHGPRDMGLILLVSANHVNLSGPGGIRTRDLISAIDARSQLRYRPRFAFENIVVEGKMSVKRRRRRGNDQE